jgi:hypothetical protein
MDRNRKGQIMSKSVKTVVTGIACLAFGVSIGFVLVTALAGAVP